MPASVTRSERSRVGGLGRLLGTALALLPALAAAQDAGADLRASIGNGLVVPTEQRLVGYRWDREPGIIALYFGADWCGPCHAFIPELKRIRATLKQAGADTEVVYVSLDTSEREMHRYMRRQQMPWPALDYRKLHNMPAVKRLAGPAPPNLMLIGRDGQVIASGWQEHRYIGLKPVLDAWLKAVSGPHSLRHLSVVSSTPARPSP